MKMKCYSLLIICLVVLLASSCISILKPGADTTKPEAGNTASKEKVLPDEKEYMGAGTSDSLLTAMQLSKASAIEAGVKEILGEEAAEENKEKLQEILYSANNAGAYAEPKERTRKDKSGENYIYESSYIVNLKAIQSTLKAHGILGDKPTETGNPSEIVKNENKTDAKSDTKPQVSEPDYAAPTASEKEFVARYVDNLTFLVYFSEETGEDEFFMRGGVSMANEYLITNGLNAVDIAQIEKLKEEQQMVYEEETGESMSIIQWIAQKLNADMYIEIYGTTSGSSKLGGMHYGTANVTLKAYESSTGELVGSVAYNMLDNAAQVSKVSQKDAKLRAMEVVIYKYCMERLVTQVKEKMRQTLLKGIKYEVIIQNPPNDRIMSKFWKGVKRTVKSYELENQSEKEIKYSVWMIGSIEDLKDAFYDASESIPELENLYSVIARGKTITFNSGL